MRYETAEALIRDEYWVWNRDHHGLQDERWAVSESVLAQRVSDYVPTERARHLRYTLQRLKIESWGTAKMQYTFSEAVFIASQGLRDFASLDLPDATEREEIIDRAIHDLRLEVSIEFRRNWSSS